MVNVMASSFSSQNSTFSTILTQNDEEGRYSAKEERPSFSVRTARFKQMKPSRFSTWKSSKISIPLGLKPSDLLDSPILRPPIDQAEASPTTGTSPLPPIVEGNISTIKSPSDSLDKTPLQAGAQIIIYKPIPSFGLNGFSSLSTRDDTMAVTKTSTSVSSPDLAPQIRMASGNPHQASDNVKQDQPLMQICRTLNLEISSEDGYSWRKYGQKLVKNSKFPRSYFRCAYPSCPVKKMVEESKVVIKGEHNHPPKPQLIRKLPTGVLQSISRNSKEGSIALPSRVDSSLDHIVDASSNRDKGPKLPSELMHISEPSSASSIIEGRAGTEWTKVLEREAITRSKLGNDKDGPKSRKKVKVGETASKLSLRTFHEPRHVERIKCNSGVVDDGYRWCKYGQKAIKGNPHPRSYYKCHSPGCPVRKHVERSATDEVTVISTYEGQHNHEAPTSRFSSSAISGSFITAITLPHISSSSRSIPKSSQLPLQDHAGEKLLENDNLNKDSESVMSVIPFLTVTNSAASKSAVTDAQPLSMCLAYPEREVMGPSMTKMATLQLLTSGSDGKSAFQRAELSSQSETFIMKSEPEDGEELPNKK